MSEIRYFRGLDSLGYLSIENLVQAAAIPKQDFCLACFEGHYPVPIQEEFNKFGLE